MANKNLNSRIQLRFDTWSNWLSIAEDESKILNAGEVAVVSIPANSTNVDGEIVKTPPVTLFKVGNGESTFGSLPWLSALAADVHPWAKQTEEEFKTWLDNQLQEGTVGYVTVAQLDELASRVKDAEDSLTAEATAREQGDAAILGTDADEATANTVFGAKAAAKAADDKAAAAAGAASAAQSTADEALANANAAQDEVDALEEVVAGKADATALDDYYKISDADAKFATIETAEGLRTDVDDNKAAIEVLNGADTVEGSVAAKVKVATDAAAAADEKAEAAQEHSEGVASDLAAEVTRATEAEEAAASAAAAAQTKADQNAADIVTINNKFADYVTVGTLQSTVTTLNGSIDAKVSTADYEAKVAELEEADSDLDTAVKAAQTAADSAQAAADAAQAEIDAFMGTIEAGGDAVDTLQEVLDLIATGDEVATGLLTDVANLKTADTTLQSNIDKKADQSALDEVAADVTTIKNDYLTSVDILILDGGTATELW